MRVERPRTLLRPLPPALTPSPNLARRLPRGLAAVAVLVGGLAAAGCAQDEASDSTASEQVSPTAYGYAWQGAGEPSNFGADYTVCRRGLAREERERLVPYHTGSVQSARTDPQAARRLRSCLEGKGWVATTR